jgi:hypothetical protein
LTLDANRAGTLRFSGPGIILNAAGAPFALAGVERSYSDLANARFFEPVPATFGVGDTIDLQFPEDSNEFVQITAVPGGTLKVVVDPQGGHVALLEDATYVYNPNSVAGVTTLDASLPQATLSDAQILAQLDAEYADVNSDFRMAIDSLSANPTGSQIEAVVEAVINRFTGFFIEADDNNNFYFQRNALLTLDANLAGTLRFSGPGIILSSAGAPFALAGVERSYEDLVTATFR